MAVKQPTIEERLGDAIRIRREELKLSQEKLAFECDLHRTYISQLERGLKSPTVRTLSLIAEALKITSDELLRMAREGDK
jgi:transcriptional regulator with XRE-family HTH domain